MNPKLAHVTDAELQSLIQRALWLCVLYRADVKVCEILTSLRIGHENELKARAQARENANRSA